MPSDTAETIAREDVASPARRPDRSAALPLWAQVAADLRHRCLAGAFASGVPGELDLSAEYGVSRHTVREALRDLRAEGLIASHPGRASTVMPGAFTQRVGAVASLFRSVESQGSVQASTVLQLETTTDADVAARLDCHPRALLVVLERIRRADGVPLAHDVAWLPHTLAHPLLAADFGRTALYDELARIGTQVDSCHERITATVADTLRADQLAVHAGDPLLRIERLGLSLGRPVEWRETLIRADRFALEADWASSRTTLAVTSSPDVSTAAPTTERTP